MLVLDQVVGSQNSALSASMPGCLVSFFWGWFLGLGLDFVIVTCLNCLRHGVDVT